jgi:hypothetical protein
MALAGLAGVLNTGVEEITQEEPETPVEEGELEDPYDQVFADEQGWGEDVAGENS